MLLRELKTLKEKGCLVSVERSSFSDDDLTGKILDHSEGLVLMKLFYDSGEFDAYSLFPIDQISSLRWGNRALRSLDSLIEKNETVSPSLTLSSFEDALLQLKNDYDAICLMDSGDEVHFEVAQILEIDEPWIKAMCFGSKKTLSKQHSILRIDSFSRIEFGSKYIADTVKLHSNPNL